MSTTISAAKIREDAKQYTKDLPVCFNEGVELWGIARGSIPHHRQWWVLKGSHILGSLDQGCYEDPNAAKKQRMIWVIKLGVVDLVLEKIAQFQYDWVPVAESSWKNYL